MFSTDRLFNLYFKKIIEYLFAYCRYRKDLGEIVLLQIDLVCMDESIR